MTVTTEILWIRYFHTEWGTKRVNKPPLFGEIIQGTSIGLNIGIMTMLKYAVIAFNMFKE